MQKNTPLVTIGIPNYNYAHYIKEALDSVAAQTYSNIELIIVDDCSTDNSIILIENWMTNYSGNIAINFIKNECNLGLTGSCNVILRNAKGEYLQILDADDIFLPENISKKIEVVNENESNNIALVYSNMKLINDSGKIINDNYLNKIGYDENNMPEGDVFQELFNFNFIAYPLINITFAREAGGFDESQQVHDYYLWLKLAEKYEVKYCPGKYALYRIHNASMSNNSKTNPISVENVLRTKYRYIKEANSSMKEIIKRDIYNSVTTLYENKIQSSGIWLKRNLILNFGFKSFGYYLAYNLGIPFSFFGSIKKLAGNKINTK